MAYIDPVTGEPRSPTQAEAIFAVAERALSIGDKAIAEIDRLQAKLDIAVTALAYIADGAVVTLDVSHPWVGQTARDALAELKE